MESAISSPVSAPPADTPGVWLRAQEGRTAQAAAPPPNAAAARSSWRRSNAFALGRITEVLKSGGEGANASLVDADPQMAGAHCGRAGAGLGAGRRRHDGDPDRTRPQR